MIRLYYYSGGSRSFDRGAGFRDFKTAEEVIQWIAENTVGDKHILIEEYRGI